MDIRVETWTALQETLFENSWQEGIARFRSNYVFRGVPRVSHALETSLQTGGLVAKERHLLASFRKYAARNAVQRAYVMAAEDLIDEEWLPQPIGDGAAPSAAQALAAREPALSAAGGDGVMLPIGTSMAQAERLLILATLRHYDHHKERTAAALGISLKTLYNRLKEYAAEEASEGSSAETAR